VAANAQSEEAYKVILQWGREETDSKLAIQLAETYEEEAKLQESLVLAMDKETALKIAIDERIRLKQEQKEREELEKMDFEFAKKFFVDEGRRLLESQKLCAEDEKLVGEWYRSYQELSTKECDEYKVSEEEKMTTRNSQSYSAEKRRIREDFQFASKLQQEMNTEAELRKAKQEITDFRLSRRMLIKTSRSEHQRAQRNKVIAKLSSSLTMSLSSAALAQLWEEAEAQVENVCGGICITILLPNIVKLKVGKFSNAYVELIL